MTRARATKNYRDHGGRLTFGRRVSTFCVLRTTRPLDEVLLERTGDGWLFLLPATMDYRVLCVVTASPDPVPVDSMARVIELSSPKGSKVERTPATAWHPVAPILHHTLIAKNVIRTGEAAFTFDPLCGDRAGYSIRSAVLASTVAADVLRQELRCLDYYQFHLIRTFRAHLQACCQDYNLWNTPDWQHKVASMKQGIAYLNA